jgi:hypothetical protein
MAPATRLVERMVVVDVVRLPSSCGSGKAAVEGWATEEGDV